MKDLIMIGLMVGIFLFGFFIMKRIDDFFEENQRRIADDQIRNKQLIQIASETPMLLDSVSDALKYASTADPDIEFTISSGSGTIILQKLTEGSVDLVLLKEDTACGQNTGFRHIEIPYCTGSSTTETIGLPVSDLDDNTMVYVLWNQTHSSRARDGIISAIKNSLRAS